ncbi:hypothetical protein DL762_006318 [Monosporascus cannonballus]|uniref:Cytochrome P450 n=1 Tax=Monosporascus cannonballus TaxID=155416 RepID=A0ABY0H5E9_9PEZI|nr:hypothetical protein DL762_006318 [Monosporascus cannonballus]
MEMIFASLALLILSSLASAGAHKSLNPWTVAKTFAKTVMKRIHAWEYVFRGPWIIQAGYNNSNGQPYEVPTPDTRYVFVSAPKHIEEIDRAPDDVLSLQAASKHMLQPKYTMHGFIWSDLRGTEGVGFERSLRVILTSHLPSILHKLNRYTKARFDLLQQESPIVQGSRRSKLYPMMKKVVVVANAHAIFGEELGKNEEFLDTALNFVDQTVYGAEPLRLLPKFLVPIFGRIMASQFSCDKKMFGIMLPVVEQRFLERDQKRIGHKVPHHDDCLQWIMETSPKKNPWSPMRVIWELMAIWFGSVHSLSVTSSNAIYDLCLQPEYLQPLRDEINAHYDGFLQSGSGLPLLDSFLKESARLNPVETMSTRRCAIRPFTFSDGTKLGVGDWACTPVYAIMKDSEHYPEPLKFNGFRFVDPKVLEGKATNEQLRRPAQPKPSQFADVDNTWQIWGTGRMACPGRFYASALLKVIVAQIIANYDFELPDPATTRVGLG